MILLCSSVLLLSINRRAKRKLEPSFYLLYVLYEASTINQKSNEVTKAIIVCSFFILLSISQEAIKDTALQYYTQCYQRSASYSLQDLLRIVFMSRLQSPYPSRLRTIFSSKRICWPNSIFPLYLKISSIISSMSSQIPKYPFLSCNYSVAILLLFSLYSSSIRKLGFAFH